MAEFLFVYLGGKAPETEEEGAKEMQKWMEYFETHGAKFRDPGNPVKQSYSVDSQGTREGSANPVMGYGIVKADSLDEALEIATANPHIDAGGTVEVAEIFEIEM